MNEIPRATYRCQFGPGMTFRDAEALVPYLARLGISHLYASPILKARKGSTHGYDITDHNALNDELGGEEGFEALVAALRANGMGLILDFVPNHMGVGRSDNAWWLDVLEWGPASPYAGYFDIDWQPGTPELRGKVLLPFLGGHYGDVLEGGELVLRFDATAGSFSVWYHDHRFPIAPRDYARILSAVPLSATASFHREAESIAQAFRDPILARPVGHRAAAARLRSDGLKQELAQLAQSEPGFRDHVQACLDHFNGTPGDQRSFVALHRLLQRQHYRPAFWRVASNEINYRRFFDINELAGIRIERPEVFDAVHRRVLEWIGEDKIQGLRIDHIDGLYDPEAYCVRLQAAVAAARAGKGDGATPFYVVVEKILAQHETLPATWPVAGTTGYEFTNLLNGLFVDPEAERVLDVVYRRFTGNADSFDDVLYAAKRRVLERLLAAELNVLATQLDRIAETDWRTRDFTEDGIKDALTEVAASFPVYRTYVSARRTTDEDRRDIDWAIAWARRRLPDRDTGLLEFVHSVLTADLVRRRRRTYSRRAVVDFAMRFQQFTSPVTAKALEDTSLYRFNRLVSLNEVGGDPRRFGVSPAAFHRTNAERLRRHPYAMLATTTHDTKRSEDARARIDVISEMPREWASRVRRWARMNRAARVDADGGPAPSPNDEYLLYQALIGSWPLAPDGEGLSGDALESFMERIGRFLVKALREAKTRSSWTNPDEGYEEATLRFARHITDPQRSSLFLADFVPFQRRIARLGMVNGLAQTAMKLCVPGVPDLYQGTEYWDLSLVDPDNRRPVDFPGRSRTLDALIQDFAGSRPDNAGLAARLLEQWPDGRIKQFVIWRLLQLRQRFPGLFLEGAYEPLPLDGRNADHACAFARRAGDLLLIAVVPRLLARSLDEAGDPLPGAMLWHGTSIRLCGSLPPEGGLVDAFTGRSVRFDGGGNERHLPLDAVFATLPVAVLVPYEAGGAVRSRRYQTVTGT